MEIKKNIKICHLTSAHPPYDIRIFHKECVSLAEQGYSVFLICAGAENEVKKGVNILGVKKNNSRFGRMFITVWRVYKKALEVDAELYHFHDPELMLVGLLLKQKGKKVIYDVHEDVPKQILNKHWISNPMRLFISAIYKKSENYCAARFSAVVTATPSIKIRFTDFKIPAYTVNNFPFLNELKTEKKISSKDNSTIKYVCYLGGISEVRGLTYLVKAMALLDNCKLIMAGKCSPENYLSELQNTEGWHNIIYKGLVQRGELSEILAQSEAGIVTFLPIPNHIDAQPNKMFEYMSSGIPVISSDFPLWKEIILKNNCGMCVEPTNPKAIAEAIQYIIDNTERAKEMGNNGLKSVTEKYNWESEKVKLFDLYNQIFNS